MAVVEIRVTKYKTSDGTLFDDKEEAQKYDSSILLRERLKAQYALDVETCKTIDGLDAWQLWQHKKHYLDWETIKISFYFKWSEYRRHPHADNIISYHKCSESEKKRWQCDDGVAGWYTEKPITWNENWDYRLKPETITINGKEYAAPLRVAPYLGAEYWWYSSICGVKNDIWSNDCMDRERLSSNCVFVLHDDCQAVADAFNAILTGDDNE